MVLLMDLALGISFMAATAKAERLPTMEDRSCRRPIFTATSPSTPLTQRISSRRGGTPERMDRRRRTRT